MNGFPAGNRAGGGCHDHRSGSRSIRSAVVGALPSRKGGGAARNAASRILSKAEDEAEDLRKRAALQGKEEAYLLREAWEREESRRRDDLERVERRAAERSDALDRKFDILNQREERVERRVQNVEARSSALAEKEDELRALGGEILERLESLSGISAEEAKKELLQDLEEEARRAGRSGQLASRDSRGGSADRTRGGEEDRGARDPAHGGG